MGGLYRNGLPPPHPGTGERVMWCFLAAYALIGVGTMVRFYKELDRPPVTDRRFEAVLSVIIGCLWPALLLLKIGVYIGTSPGGKE